MALYEKVLQKLKNSGQEHLLTFYNDLTKDQKQKFLKTLDEIPYDNYVANFNRATHMKHEVFIYEPLEHNVDSPLYSYHDACDMNVEELNKFKTHGLFLISKVKVGLLLLAGGQGSRLGWEQPKATYPIGPISKSSFFKIFAERLHKLTQLATGDPKAISNLPLYILTADHNHDFTVKFFEENFYFGLKKADVFIFKQRSIPAFDFEGKILLSKKMKSEIFTSPNGNGGVLKKETLEIALNDMIRRNLKFLHVVSIDNPLQKVLDPTLMGYFDLKGADTGISAIKREDPDESIGVICTRHSEKRKKECFIVEYSELPNDLRYQKDEKGNLKQSAGNICNYLYTIDFLKDCLKESDNMDIFIPHVAKKKIPYIDLNTGKLEKPIKPNGIKIEYLCFDVLPLAKKMAVLEALREDCFSPLKNASGECSAETCHNAMTALYRRWLTAVGAKIIGGIILVKAKTLLEGHLEISPLVSYEGEGLEKFSDTEIKLPCYIS